jgi:hypothetical protein
MLSKTGTDECDAVPEPYQPLRRWDFYGRLQFHGAKVAFFPWKEECFGSKVEFNHTKSIKKQASSQKTPSSKP